MMRVGRRVRLVWPFSALLLVSLSVGQVSTESLISQLHDKDRRTVENALRELLRRREPLGQNADYKQRLSEILVDSKQPAGLRELSAFALGRIGSEAAMQESRLEYAL